MTNLHLRLTSRALSPSHTFTGQWTTGSTLAVEPPRPLATKPIGHCEVTDSTEMITLKLKVAKLEVALEKIRCRLDALTTEKQGILIASVVRDTR